jgi:hypothetical protein
VDAGPIARHTEPIVSASKTPTGPQPVFTARRAVSYAISVDTLGKLRWSSGDLDGDHLVCVLSERAPADYLTILRELGKKHRWESASLKPAHEQNPKICLLELTAELGRRHTNHAPEHLSEMARARVAHIECDLDQAPRCFADELLGVGDAFARNEAQWRHAGRLLEDPREVERTELN